jgi:hypothetical protein
MRRNLWLVGTLGAATLALGLFVIQPAVGGQTNADKSAIAGTDQISGLGTISGSVKAPKDF